MYEKYIKNLRDLVLRKIEERRYTLEEFSVMCDISYRELQRLTSGEIFRMRIDILVNICENARISYIDVFECYKEADINSVDKIMKSFILTDGTLEYRLDLKD